VEAAYFCIFPVLESSFNFAAIRSSVSRMIFLMSVNVRRRVSKPQAHAELEHAGGNRAAETKEICVATPFSFGA
jgi:hypothetical protein